MPTLNWIGKDAVVNHHKEVPFRLLKPIDKFSVGDESGNLLVQGDNLEALKALLPYYAGQVKCIYIDPPYNTGNESWVYNDNVNSPEMKEWLGKVVGGEAEDLSRHDKWLCMMYPRLVLLREMLSEDGSIFISIDDNEVSYLRCIMDEIFSKSNFLCIFAWEKRYGPPPDTKDIGYTHESIVAYRKSSNFSRNLLPATTEQLDRYKNPDNDPRGNWKAMDYTSRYSKDERPNLYYPITNPNTGKTIYPKSNRVWAFSREEHKRNEQENMIWWGKNGTANVPAKKNFLSGIAQGSMPVTLLKYDQVGHTHEATKELQSILPDIKMTPKPTRLIQYIIQIAAGKYDIVLDSFAGSGTTGHAVLKQNADDGGNRRFILVEMDKNIAQNITAERLKRVAQGYSYKDQKGNKKKETGLGGGFRYCELGVTLFDADGQIREEVKYNDLAQHVYFIETGQPLPIPPPFPKGKGAKSQFPLLGVHNGTAVYLLYNGVLKDRKPNGGNVLTRAVLKSLPPPSLPPNGGKVERKIIYGTGCLLSEEKLRELGITFRQIPYEVKAS